MTVVRTVITFVLFILLAGPALAEENRPRLDQPKIEKPDERETAALALKFYDRCMEDPDPSVSHNTQHDGCVCLSEQMKQKLTPGEMEFVLGNKEGTKLPRTRLYEEIYAPCIHHAAWEQSYYQCYDNDDYRVMFSTAAPYRYFCGCIADRISDYVQETALYFLAALLHRRPDTKDPIGAVLKSSGYAAEFESARSSCMQIVGSVRWPRQRPLNQ